MARASANKPSTSAMPAALTPSEVVFLDGYATNGDTLGVSIVDLASGQVRRVPILRTAKKHTHAQFTQISVRADQISFAGNFTGEARPLRARVEKVDWCEAQRGVECFGDHEDPIWAPPAGVIGTTAENLRAAADGEHHEWTDLYPGFAKIAREEGFAAAAAEFDMISVAEKQHERRYRGLLENVENSRVFKRSTTVKWRCLNCGYVHEGPEALAACPACAHPQAYFELLAENW